MDKEQTCDWAEARFSAHLFESPLGKLPFRLHVPSVFRRGQRHPFLLLMHGAGGLGTDNRQQLFTAGLYGAQPDTRFDELFIAVPQCPPSCHWIEHGSSWAGTNYRFSPQPTSSMALALELLDTLLETLPIDRQRLAVGGASMGGYATWDILSRRPGLFRAAFPICGVGDPTQAPACAQSHLWVTHGACDPCVLPEGSRRMVAALDALQADCHYCEFPGVEHDAWTPTLTAQDFHRWLNSHLFPNSPQEDTPRC